MRYWCIGYPYGNCIGCALFINAFPLEIIKSLGYNVSVTEGTEIWCHLSKQPRWGRKVLITVVLASEIPQIWSNI